MKYCLGVLILFGILGADSLYGQQANWLWARSGGGKARDQTAALAVDGAGNVYVTGYFRDSALFSTSTLYAASGNHFFLAKYSPSGTLLWIQTSAVKGQSYGTGLCMSEGRFLYLTGYFSDSLSFSSGTLISSGDNDIFLAKLDLDGNAIWAVKAGSPGLDQARSVSADPSGNIYITGNFSGTAHFGSQSITSVGGDDIFLAQYSPTGVLNWVKRFGGSGDDAGWGVAAARSGSIAITGTFSASVDFGGPVLNADGASDIFIAKYNSQGNSVWVQQAHDTTAGIGESIAIDPEDNIYVTGRFEVSGFVPDCDGTGNIYIAKFSSSGVIQWQKCAGNGGEESGDAIALDSLGNVFVAGGYDYVFDFGAGLLSHNSFIDAYIVKFDGSGKALWSDRTGTTGDDEGFAVATDRDGNVFMGGLFSDSIYCGPYPLRAVKLADAFVAKIGGVSVVHDLGREHAPELRIYPNPASYEIMLRSDNISSGCELTVELYSAVGEKIRSIGVAARSGSENGVTIPISDLPTGTYVCSVFGLGWRESGMIVVGP